MAILEEFVEVTIGSRSFKHYKELGYDVKVGSAITVPISELTPGSRVEVTCICDKCGAKNVMKYSAYTGDLKRNNGLYWCKSCSLSSQERIDKIKATNMERYGVPTTLLVPEVQEKIKQTNIELYGDEYPRRNEQVAEKLFNTMEELYGVRYGSQVSGAAEKREQTCMERYGVPYSSQSPKIKEKTRQTNIRKFGVPCCLQNPKVSEKQRNTMTERYGAPYSGQSPELRRKQALTLKKNGNVPTSKQQKYLWILLGGDLNGVIGYYNCDIVFYDKHYIIEYDGGAHDLRVKSGKITQEEFDKQQLKRFYVIKRQGYSQIRIISRQDWLPSDEVIKDIIKQSESYFTTTGHSWINWDIDSGCFYNAVNPDGIEYDFGSLRQIKDEATA